jgi:alpha-beta hydrolase superfamily lysophospholipase
VVLVHGWESSRDRTLPMAHFLVAAGFHVLTVDIRGHGANQAEELPVSAGEFGTDALAAFEALLARPEVTTGAIAGHSMGGIGAILAAAADPRVAALVATSSPAEPYRLTRQTFRLARLPIPDVIAYPLAMLTTLVYLRPRGHKVGAISASNAITRYDGPILLLHGDTDDVVPIAHLRRLARIVRAVRAGRTAAAPVESLVIEGGRHSWLYEFPAYRRTVARFLAQSLGGPYVPDEAGDRAAAVQATRLPDGEIPFSAVTAEPGGIRSLAGLVTRRPAEGHGLPDEGLEEPELPAAPSSPPAATVVES